MTMEDFINENWREIDECIESARGGTGWPLDNDDREEWIMNDEGLYNWALSEGVEV